MAGHVAYHNSVFREGGGFDFDINVKDFVMVVFLVGLRWRCRQNRIMAPVCAAC